MPPGRGPVSFNSDGSLTSINVNLPTFFEPNTSSYVNVLFSAIVAMVNICPVLSETGIK